MGKESVHLHCTTAGSNKGYQCSLEEEGAGWTVKASYGAWGNTYRPADKTSSPVPYEKAKKIFDSTVAEKLSKGYLPVSDASQSVQAVVSSVADAVTGIFPSLLTPLGEDEIERLIRDPNYCAQQKFDGKRIQLECKAFKVRAINKSGKVCGIHQQIELDAHSKISDTMTRVYGTKGEFLVDGEQIGCNYYVFDLLDLNGRDLRSLPYHARFAELCKLPKARQFIIAETACTEAEKRALYEKLKAGKQEGIVFKRKTAQWSAGRGDDAYKIKFWATANARVLAQNVAHSVKMGILDGGKETDVGNCTIAQSVALPDVGSIIEVKYLYVANRGGKLYQPQFQHIRDDIDVPDDVGSLKYKPENAEED